MDNSTRLGAVSCRGSTWYLPGIPIPPIDATLTTLNVNRLYRCLHSHMRVTAMGLVGAIGGPTNGEASHCVHEHIVHTVVASAFAHGFRLANTSEGWAAPTPNSLNLYSL